MHTRRTDPEYFTPLLHERSYKPSLYGRVSNAVLGGLGSVSSVFGIWFRQSGHSTGSYFADRVIRTFSPFALGMSVVKLLRAAFPSQAFLNRLHTETWRIGIPFYFGATQFYLSTEQEFILYLMAFAAGAQFETLLASYFQTKTPVKEHAYLDAGDISEDVIVNNIYKPLENISLQSQLIGAFVTSVIGTTCFVLPYIMTLNSDAGDSSNALGGYLLSHTAMSWFWHLIKTHQRKLENTYQVSIRQNTFQPKMPRSLLCLRVIEKVTLVATPILTTLLLYRPLFPEVDYGSRLAVAGGLDGIYNRIHYDSFFNTPRNELPDLYTKQKPDSRAARVLETSWKVVRLLSEFGGLSFFFYRNFFGADANDKDAVVAMTAGLLAAYALTTATDLTHRPLGKSGVRNQLYHRMVVSPAIPFVLEIDPLVFYLYAAFKPIKIGSSHLTHLSPQEKILKALIWAIYGWRMGQDSAASESLKAHLPPRVSRFLLSSIVILLSDMMRII